jgi:hypothetical protein
VSALRSSLDQSIGIIDGRVLLGRTVLRLGSECHEAFGREMRKLQHAISQFMAHYHAERNHQGLENRLVQPAPVSAPSPPVRRRQRLGGMLNYYHHAAAE